MEHLFALVIVDVPTYDAVEAALAPYDKSLMLAADGELEPCACNDPHCVQCDGAGVVVVSGGARHRWGGEQWNTLPSRGEARNFIRQRLLADNEERWVAGVDILTG